MSGHLHAVDDLSLGKGPQYPCDGLDEPQNQSGCIVPLPGVKP